MSRRRTALVLIVGLALAGWAGIRWLLVGLPDLSDPEAVVQSGLALPSLRVTDRQGRLLYEAIPGEGGRHLPVPVERIPRDLRLATISTEDASFYNNPGFDPAGIVRAAWTNLLGGETVSGGSTITQQVARNLLMSPEERGQRTLRRKLRETWLAWQLTRRLDKDEILSLYLNQMYYGGLAYGVEAAAQTFFGKPAESLDLAESALLAGLTQSPGLYNPFTNFEAAKQRQITVLALMEKHGFISPSQRELAAREPLVLASQPYPMEAPHFVLGVLAELDTVLPHERRPALSGLVVRTSLDLDWQSQAEAILRQQLARLNSPPAGEPSHNVHNAALVALDPYSGEILAMVGSPDYFDPATSGAVNMAVSPTQPGSALKPLIYAAALDPQRVKPWTAATMILDVRTTFQTRGGLPYTPENYDLREHGPVLAREALASSLNIPAVAALNEVGLEAAVNLAAELGITTLGNPEQYDLSLALGGGAVRLLELTAAYAAFANGGYRVTPVTILEVTTLSGEKLFEMAPANRIQVLDPGVAWLISDILSDDDARRTGFGANSTLRLDRPAAVKTGTTTNFHDNWTVGYTPELAVGVWVGNADHQPMREVTGLTGAAPAWHQFMRSALRGRPERSFDRPDSLVRLEVCALSGKLPTPDCPLRRLEWFISGTEPAASDDLYRRVAIDSATGRLAGDSTPAERRLEQVVLNLPPQAQPWARLAGIQLLSDLLEGPDLGDEPLQLIAPGQNAVFRLTSDTPQESQRIRLMAVGRAAFQQVTLWVDGEPLTELSAAPYETWWTLRPGQHSAWAEGLTLAGERVTSAAVQFEVRE